MTEASLATTNLLLGIMAAVSVIEIIALVAAAMFGYRAYSRLKQTLDSLEARHVAPLTARTSAVLDDLKSITARAKRGVGSLEQQIRESTRRAGEIVRRGRSRATRAWQQVESIGIGVREAIAALLDRSGDIREPPRRPALRVTSEILDDARIRTGR